MSEIIYQGRGVTVSKFAGPARDDGVSRVCVQILLNGSGRVLSFTLDEWLIIAGAGQALWAANSLPICYRSDCQHTGSVSVPHARRTGCPTREGL